MPFLFIFIFNNKKLSLHKDLKESLIYYLSEIKTSQKRIRLPAYEDWSISNEKNDDDC